MEQNINDKKNEIKIGKKENFKEKYSKIDLMRQKHKEYIKFDKEVRFSLGDYKLEKIKDDKLKKILDMLETTSYNKYNIKFQKPCVLFTSSYNFKNKKNSQGVYDFYNTGPNEKNMEKFKNSENGTTVNKIYSFFQEVNKMNSYVSPNKNMNYIYTEPKLDENKKKEKKINKNYFVSNSQIEKKYEPLTTKYLNLKQNNTIVLKKNHIRLKPLSDDFSNLTLNFNIKNKSVSNSYRNANNNLLKNNNKTENNLDNWYEKFIKKYNHKYYSNELNKFGFIIDSIGYSSNIRKKEN